MVSCLSGEFYQTLKELMPSFFKIFPKKKWKRNELPDSYETSVIFTSKPDKNITRTENYRPISLTKIEAKILLWIERSWVALKAGLERVTQLSWLSPRLLTPGTNLLSHQPELFRQSVFAKALVEDKWPSWRVSEEASLHPSHGVTASPWTPSDSHNPHNQEES